MWSCLGYIWMISLTHLALEDLRAEWMGRSWSRVPVTFTSAPKGETRLNDYPVKSQMNAAGSIVNSI